MSAPAAPSRLLLKQTPLDTWSTREHLALASAVLRSGEQNWAAVTRTMKGFADPNRPDDWISQKACAQQYARLLELTDAPRQKRDAPAVGGGVAAADKPGDAVVRRLREDRCEELRKRVAETRAAYTALKQEIRQLRSGQLDSQLDDIQRQIAAEKEAAAEESEKRRQWLSEREQQKLAVQQQALRVQVTKHTPSQPLQQQQPPPAKRRRLLMLERTESGQSEEADSVPEDVWQAAPESPVGGGDATPTDTNCDEESRDCEQQRPPAPSSPLLTSLLRSPTAASRGSASAAEPAVGPSAPPTLSRLLDLPPAAPGHPLPQLSALPDQRAGGEATLAAEAGDVALAEVPAVREEQPVPHPVPQPPEAAAPAEVKSEPEPMKERSMKEEPLKEEPLKEIADSPAGPEEVAENAPPFAVTGVTKRSEPTVNSTTSVGEKILKQTDPPPPLSSHQDSNPKGATTSTGESRHSPCDEPTPQPEPAPGVPAHKQEVVTDAPKPESKVKAEATETTRAAQDSDASVRTVFGDGGRGDGPTTPQQMNASDIKKEPVEEEEVTADTCSVLDAASVSASSSQQEQEPREEPTLVKEERPDTESDTESLSQWRRQRSGSATVTSTPAAAALSTSESFPGSPASGVLSGDDTGGGGDERRDHKLWKRSVLLLWREMAGHRHASMFARAITPEQAPGYKDAVRTPMDLAQLKKNVETGVCTSTRQFQRDLMLMFCNAQMFNPRGHQVAAFARDMQQDCVAKIESLLLAERPTASKSTRRETRESSRDEQKRKRSTEERPTPTRKRR